MIITGNAVRGYTATHSALIGTGTTRKEAMYNVLIPFFTELLTTTRANDMKNLYITIAPTGDTPQAPDVLRSSIGMIPEFLRQALEQPELPLGEAMSQVYGFPSEPIIGGSFDDKGVYTYPEDPILTPIARIETDKRGHVDIFMYGLVGVHEKNKESLMYRFD